MLNINIIFIRHGEPNYADCEKRNFIGQARDFSPLTDLGIIQAETVSQSRKLCDAELIISSPYTRALQTAAIISRQTQIPIKVEIDLHEFLSDKSFSHNDRDTVDFLHKEFCKNKGEKNPDGLYNWETLNEIILRTYNVLLKYTQYQKIIIVSHGGVIRRYVGKKDIEYCKPYEIEFNQNFKCYGWID